MRVLIISPHFPPTNAADMQRVRLILPYLAEANAITEVLSVEPAQVAAPQDAWLAAGLPPEVPIHRIRVLGLGWSRVPGLGTLSFRALGAIRRKGDQLLGRRSESERQNADRGDVKSEFDLVYFSTTQFALHALGPRWKKKFGVPFVMDYQDPWVSDYYRKHPEVVPPGGRLKYGLASWLNRRQEPWVLRECCGITSVSPAYPKELAKRYPWLKVEASRGQRSGISDQKSEMSSQRSEVRDQTLRTISRLPNFRFLPSDFQILPFIVLPFPGDVRDFERVKADDIRQTIYDSEDGFTHWVYVGRGGEDMQKASAAIFKALRLHADGNPGFLGNLRLHFIGTSYAAAGHGTKTLEGLADALGLGEVVTEHTDRIPYSETLRCLLDADALIIPGSDDPGYTASKIYPYLLVEKPLLAVFHEQSSVVNLIHEVGGGTVIPFATGEAQDSIAARIASAWLATGGPEQALPLNQAAFAPNAAREQAACLARFWKYCLSLDKR